MLSREAPEFSAILGPDAGAAPQLAHRSALRIEHVDAPRLARLIEVRAQSDHYQTAQAEQYPHHGKESFRRSAKGRV